ncbi:hypothetical protein MF672_016930 [Actinomadura sp. ATCC 31491]|uniref:Uncharacterized protein n=1 Tax=Actinomadura luzonensis TaxID=2805427 RepID=A0ABT0FU84_9ACTN|nr:hypothetical protein [Actinomadura luzonensis]MCK2215461.1 hypothetical protein [Actinomadura luzonensis]
MDEFVPELLEFETALPGYRRAAGLANALLARGWALMAEVAPTGPGRRAEQDVWIVRVIATAGEGGSVRRCLQRVNPGGEVTTRAPADGLDRFLSDLLDGPD